MRTLAAVVVAALVAGTLLVAQAPLDLGQAAEWDPPARPVQRESSIQRMIIDILDIDVPPGTQVAQGRGGDRPGHGFLAAVLRVFRPATQQPFLSTRGGLWLYPARARAPQGVTRPTRVHAYLSALGTSTGEAFDIQIVNDGTEPVRIGGDGIVVEPIKKGSDAALRSELRQIASRQSGVKSVRANAYCLEYKLKPPDQGTLFRVVDARTQAQYQPAREILRASRRLQESGQLQPDSNPADYYHAIRQWAIWVNEQKFTMSKYRDAFVDRTKRNVEAMGQRWSKQLEDGLKALVPHRWEEITKILGEARQPVPGA